MSKITKLEIKEMFGIKFLSLDGKSIELSGDNGTGKTSVPDAVIYALKNKSNRKYIIREGATEGEVLIETDAGLSINRKERKDQASYKNIRDNGKPIQSPESFLSSFVTELQLNPNAFIAMDTKEQNRMILDLIDFKWDLNWIKEQFGEVVPDIEWNQNILRVLHDIQSEDGFYFLKRHDKNLEAREKTAIVCDIGKDLPENYNAKYWEDINIGKLYKQIQTIQHKNNQIEKAKDVIKNQDNKKRTFQAEYEIDVTVIEKETASTREHNNIEIEKLKNRTKELETENSNIEESKINKIKVAKAVYEANIAEFNAEVSQYKEDSKKTITDFSTLQKEATHIEDMKKFINEYKRMVDYQEQITKLNEASAELTLKIEHARYLPGKILEDCEIPIEGLSLKDGEPLIKGLPISNLSEGEKFDLCIDIAIQNENTLNIILLDGMEKLSDERRLARYKKLKDKNVQFIATRTTNENTLTITEL